MNATTLLCAPAVRTDVQQAIYEAWWESIESMNFRVEILGRADYAPDPWVQLTQLMMQVDGVALLGFRQMEIRQGLWRNGTREVEHITTVWSSPWMQLEAGLAIASKKPVLAAPERGVAEGVFAPENWTSDVFGAAAENPRSTSVKRWAAAIRRNRAQRAGDPRGGNPVEASKIG
jgi:hypothetical protein